MPVQMFLKMKVKGQMRTIIKTQPINNPSEALTREANWKRAWPGAVIEKVTV